MRWQPILWLARRIGPACRDGQGAINASNILALLPALGVPTEQLAEATLDLIELLNGLRKTDG